MKHLLFVAFLGILLGIGWSKPVVESTIYDFSDEINMEDDGYPFARIS
jgi:hypothetical protein